jgi:hypothetical protein
LLPRLNSESEETVIKARKVIMTTTVTIGLLVGGIPDSIAADTSGSTHGSIVKSYTWHGTPLLDGFEFRYLSDDHQMSRIGQWPEVVWPGNQRIELSFHDKNKDDRYSYNVTHVEHEDPSVFWPGFGPGTGWQNCIGGRCTHYLGRPSSSHVFVLVGFDLKFGDGVDHNVDEIMVVEDGGYLHVAFNDQNDDDRFQWRVRYAYLPRHAVVAAGTVGGTRARNKAHHDVVAGRSVVSGFHFDFKPYFTDGNDHHLKSINVATPNGGIDVQYSDKNGDDGFNWLVKFALIK